MRLLLAALGLGLLASPLLAQTPGTYRMRDGDYVIAVEVEPGVVITHEPNKTSRYVEVRPGVYRFYNDNTRAAYFVRVVDAGTLEMWRDPSSGGPNWFFDLDESGATATPRREHYLALADRYRLLAEGDPDNVQVWTFCAATARAYADRPGADADDYARRAAEQLRSIAVDPNRNPCRDAIPDAFWSGTGSTTASASASPPAGSEASQAPTVTQAAGDLLREEATERLATAASEFLAELDVGTGNSFAAPPQLTERQQELVVAAGRLLNDWFEERDRRREAALQERLSGIADEFAAFEAVMRRYAADGPRANEVRNLRLESGIIDAVGFDTPLRPSADQVVIPGLGARVVAHGVVAYPAFSFQEEYEAAEGLELNEVAVPGSDPMRMPPEIFAMMYDSLGRMNIIAAPFQVVDYLIRLRVDGRDRTGIRCTHYAPDGSVLRTTRGEARPERNQGELVWHSRVVSDDGWDPGVYGVECATDDGPFVNATYDVF